MNEDNHQTNTTSNKVNNENQIKFPKGRVKKIIKMNDEVKLMTKNVDVYISKAVEFLIKDLSSKSEKITKYNKRKTMNPSDICKYILIYPYISLYISLLYYKTVQQ